MSVRICILLVLVCFSGISLVKCLLWTCALDACGNTAKGLLDEEVYAMQVVCGGEHTMVISQQGRVFTWGRGNSGQTGLGTTDTVTLPARLEALEDHCVTQVIVMHRPDRHGVGWSVPDYITLDETRLTMWTVHQSLCQLLLPCILPVLKHAPPCH